MSETIDVMRRHVSVREFTAEPIPEHVLRSLLEAGRCASTWRSLQSYSIVITTPEQRAALFGLLGQKFITDCAEFLVFVGDLARAATSLHEADIEPVFQGVEPLLISAVDAAMAGQNVLAAAESIGLGGVFCGYLRHFSAEAAELLGLPQYTYPLMGLALGTPKVVNPPKPRLPYDVVVHRETYKPVDPAVLDAYDQTILAYPVDQRGDMWSDRFVDQFGRPGQTSSTENIRRAGLG